MKILGFLIILVLLAFGAYSVGLLNIGTTGELKTPEVSVSGGEVPNVEVETGQGQRRHQGNDGRCADR